VQYWGQWVGSALTGRGRRQGIAAENRGSSAHRCAARCRTPLTKIPCSPQEVGRKGPIPVVETAGPGAEVLPRYIGHRTSRRTTKSRFVCILSTRC